MKRNLTTTILSRWFATSFVVFAVFGEAHATSMEQAKAKCHAQFVPVVRECVHRKMAESGGSGFKYIPGCRAAIMPQARACVAKLLGGGDEDAAENGADNGQSEIDLPAPSGKGRVVIVLSGRDGTDPYADYAGKLAKLGYYTVLLDGKDILSSDMRGGDRLQQAIAKAQSSADALPGKVAVVGFSQGGGGALSYAERQPETVATVIAYYPATSFIAKVTDMKTFVGKFQVPSLVFAGGKDTYRDCCLLTIIKDMDAKAKELGKPMELVVYPDAGHNFIKGAGYRADDAEDAWKRTVERLHHYLDEAPAN